MKDLRKRSLTRSSLMVCGLFILAMSFIMAITGMLIYKNSTYSRYRTSLSDLLTYIGTFIDEDDLSECINTGVASNKYHELQSVLDRIKDCYSVEHVYIVRPVDKERGSVDYIIIGMNEYERNNEPEYAVYLNHRSENDYLQIICDFYFNDNIDKRDFYYFESDTELFGSEYTGARVLFDSDGESIGVLAIDVDRSYMIWILQGYVCANVVMAVVIGGSFMVLMLLWLRRRILYPISDIKEKAVSYAERSKDQIEVDKLIFDRPVLKYNDELYELTDAIESMSFSLQDYVTELRVVFDNVKYMSNKFEQLGEIAYKDELTGVRNKTAYAAYKNKLQMRIDAGEDLFFGIVMVDVNYLKKINDTYGHEKGDIYLKDCCDMVCAMFSHSPVFRIGGDEFVVILDSDDYDNMDVLMGQLRIKINRAALDARLDPWRRISAAVGSSVYDREERTDVDVVFRRADKQMYENKLAMKAERKD